MSSLKEGIGFFWMSLKLHRKLGFEGFPSWKKTKPFTDPIIKDAFMTLHQYKLEAGTNSCKVTESLKLENTLKMIEPSF